MDSRLDGGRLEKSDSAFRTISEVASGLDIPQHVLRFWEGKFPQIKPLKRAGGRRYYRPEDVALLRRIRDLLYGEGYTIKGVQKLLREGSVRAAVAPPVVEMSGATDFHDEDIVEEDILETDDGGVTVSETVSDHAPVVIEETFSPAHEMEDEGEFIPVDAVDEVVVSAVDETAEEPSPRGALDDALEIASEDILDPSPVVEERPGELPFEGEQADEVITVLEHAPVGDVPVISAFSVDQTEGEQGATSADDASDMIMVERSSLREILMELEALRSALKGSSQAVANP